MGQWNVRLAIIDGAGLAGGQADEGRLAFVVPSVYCFRISERRRLIDAVASFPSLSWSAVNDCPFCQWCLVKRWNLLLGVVLFVGLVAPSSVFRLLSGPYKSPLLAAEPERADLTPREKLRRQKVAAELALTVVVPEVTEVPARLAETGKPTAAELPIYVEGIRKLMEAAPIMHLLYQRQIGTGPEERAKAATDDDRELFNRYGHPWCLSDSSPEGAAVPTFPKRTSGVIPDGLSCAIANQVGSPFEAIVMRRGMPKPVPYAKMWREELGAAADILRSASTSFSRIPREQRFAAHLNDLAAALQSEATYPYAQSDVSWARFLDSESLLFLRVGADEVGGDGVGDNCECKARFHFNLGIRNNEAREIVNKLGPAIPRFEQRLAELIDDPDNYVPRKIQVQLPVFIDVIFANGDDIGGPNGTNIGQTLPNWSGADGKGEGVHGTMIYVNKTLKAYSEQTIKTYVMPLLDERLLSDFNARKGLDSVVYHEIFHNLGPRDKVKKPGSVNIYGSMLTTEAGVSWRLPLEELKAQTGSLFMASEFYQEALRHNVSRESMGKEATAFRQHVIYDLAWALRMILRGSRNGPGFNPSSPYSKLAAVQVGFLAEEAAISFDGATEKWSIDFDKMPAAITALMLRTGRLYAKSDANEVEKFFLHYMAGEGEKLLHRDVLLKVAGKMPSVLFKYELNGL